MSTAPDARERVLERLREIRAYLRAEEVGSAAQLARDTLKRYPLARHTRSWVAAAANTMAWARGASRRRFTAVAAGCIQCAMEGIVELGVGD